MKLHWSPRSPFVRKVMIAAHELGLADRIATVRTVVQMDRPNPALLPDNPIGKIPTLVLDDGTALYDSLTICEYLDGLGGGRLFPAPGPARWTALTQHALGNGLLDLLILWRNERDKPAGQQTQAWLDAFAVKTASALGSYGGVGGGVGGGAVRDRAYRDRVRAVVSGLPVCGVGLARGAAGFGRLAPDVRGAALRAGDRGG